MERQAKRKKTRGELAVDLLLKRGYVEVPSTDSHYRCFRNSTIGDEYSIWIGKAGAVKVGTTLAKSVSFTREFWSIVKQYA